VNPDKADRLLAAARKRDSLDHAIHLLAESKTQIRAARTRIGGDPSYAKNRMSCVVVEIDAALRGLRCERRRLNRTIANIGRGAARGGK